MRLGTVLHVTRAHSTQVRAAQFYVNKFKRRTMRQIYRSLNWQFLHNIIIIIIVRQYLINIQAKHEIKGLQKTVILGTVHILREVLM